MSKRGLGEIFAAIDALRGDVTALRADIAALKPPSGTAQGDGMAFADGHRPKFWSDLPVRMEAIALHRQMIIAAAHKHIVEKFGAARAPSKSAIGRLWQHMDQQQRRRA